MKKAILCAILLCLILAACTAVTNEPATEPQMNVTTTSSTATTIPATNSTVTTVPPASSTVATTPSVTTIPTTVTTTGTTTAPTTKPTTWPTEKRDPCPYGHSFYDGVCIYCDSPDPCANGHTYRNSTCIHCGVAESCADGHNFDSGNCSGCGLPAMCYHNMHSYENGVCKYCQDKEPLDEDARLIVNGKDITAGNYVKINKGYRSSYIPLTAVLTGLGIPWEWESDTILRIESGEYERRLDLTLPSFGWLMPPGARGGMRKVVDGEIIMDDSTLWWELFRPLNISFEEDYETNTIRITG